MKNQREQFEALTENQESKKNSIIGESYIEATKTNAKINKIIQNTGSLTPQIVDNCIQAHSDLEKLFKKFNLSEELYREELDYMISQEFHSKLAVPKEQMEKNKAIMDEMDKHGIYPSMFVKQFGEIVTDLGGKENCEMDSYSLFNTTLGNGIRLLEYYPRENKFRINRIEVGKVDSTCENDNFDYEINIFKNGNKIISELRKLGLEVTASMDDEYVQIDFSDDSKTDIEGINNIFEILNKHNKK
ncbi:MAG: hypothetical protein PHZ26_05495 [Candidatus Gracilibacteria bacterium]|nr:hypothetical protein [Candidatus Gracilibacteria bacterium]MDD2909170.1 hypothetical protein [Candidatus Gracilibacteria bacterium]